MRRFIINGWVTATPRAWNSIRTYEIGAAGAALVLMLVLSVSGHGIAALAVILGTTAILAIARLVTYMKSLRGDQSASWLARAVVGLSGVNRHRGGVPAILSRSTVMGYSPEGVDSQLAILEHPTQGLWSKRTWVTILELGGSTLGEATALQEDARARQFAMMAGELSKASVPVTGIDLVTQVTPWNAAPYFDWLEQHSTARGLLHDQVHELVGTVEMMACQFRSWLVIHTNVSGLDRFTHVTDRTKSGLEGRAAACWDTTDQVARMAKLYGLNPVSALDPLHVGSLLGSWLDPLHDAADTTGIDPEMPLSVTTPWEALADGVAVQTPSGYWVHSFGVITRENWPSDVVTADLFDGLSTADDAQIRSLSVSFSFVHRQKALKLARMNSALGAANEIGAADKGVISTGEGEDTHDASTWAMIDLRHGAGGVAPLIRVHVCAPSMRALYASQGSLDGAMAAMGFTEVSWCPKDQVRALVSTLPLGWAS